LICALLFLVCLPVRAALAGRYRQNQAEDISGISKDRATVQVRQPSVSNNVIRYSEAKMAGIRPQDAIAGGI
jgi:hypothetical protein